MRQYLARRLLRAFIAIWGVSTIVFVVMRLSGDPVPLLLPPDSPISDMLKMRSELGLDQPLWTQYAIYVEKVAHGDFGDSIRMRQPAWNLAVERLPATLELALTSFVFSVLLALPIGVLSAVRRNSLLDNIAMLFALIGQSAPTFYVGIMLILVFAVQLGWFPTSGRGTVEQLVLPAVTLGAFAAASIARLTRSAMLDVLRTDYMRTARAKGLSERLVLGRHGLKNAAIPVITIMGLQLGFLLGGSVVTETVFAWPGVGRLAIQAIYARDYPVVQASVFLTAALFVLLNLVVDLAYGFLDPRIRYR